jgi:NAD(P)-dependent dehydrogenase (short-subunit alcohol dehydrogenase family)
MDLSGKYFLVIGGGSGIGYALATRLLETGAEVHVITRSTEGPKGSITHHADIIQSEEVFEALPEVLHGMAYCPGSINLKPLNRITKEDLMHDFEINAVGAVLSTKAVVRKLKKAKGASIVYFSTVAVQTGMGFHASVAAAKGAVEGITRSLAAELAPSNIRVNAIAPSLTDTPMASQLLSTDDKKEASAKRHPIARVGTPEEMAEAAFFLLSPASPWITGQILGIDGGLSTLR